MNKVNVSQLRQAEASELFISMLATVEKHNPTVMGVKPFFDLLKALEPTLSELTSKRIAHPLTPGIQRDIKQANELCLAIKTQVIAAQKSNLESHKAPLLLIVPLVKQYLYLSYKSTRDKFSDNTRNFLDVVTSTEAISNAAKSLGIDVYITELGVLKSSIDLKHAERSTYFVARRERSEKQIRKALNKASADLIKAIELAKVSHPTVNFGPLETELNQLFSTYRAKLSSRATRRTNILIQKESIAPTAKSVATESFENGTV